MSDLEDLKKYSGTLWGVVRVADELAQKMHENGLRETETRFFLGGEEISIKMKSS